MTRPESGFTLLELLLAVALLAMLMVLLGDSLSLVSHRLDRSIERRDRATTVVLVQNYLRAALGQALPVAVASDAGAVIDFDGSASQMTFITRLPTSSLIGGMVKLTLRFDPGKPGVAGALILDWRSYPAPGTDERRTGTRQLLAGIGGNAIAYFDPGAPDRGSGWRDSWHDMPTLPALVRISVAFRDGEPMPDLVVALRLGNPTTVNPAGAPTAQVPGSFQKTQ